MVFAELLFLFEAALCDAVEARLRAGAFFVLLVALGGLEEAGLGSSRSFVALLS